MTRTKKNKPARKPAMMSGCGSHVYAGFDESGDCIVYIGGPHYQDSAQIHLGTKKQVKRLSAWLAKASAYLDGRK